MTWRENLISKISNYCTEAEIAEATFGRLAVNDGKFVKRLRNGAGVQMDTLERVEKYIRDHAKSGAET